MAFKTLSLKEMRTKKASELNDYIAQVQLERSKMLQDISEGKAKQTHKIGDLKRTVALAHTVKREEELSSVTQEEKK